MRQLYVILVLFSPLTLSAFIDKGSDFPKTLMMDFLEQESITLSDLKTLYISFKIPREAMKERTLIIRAKTYKFIDENIILLKSLIDKTNTNKLTIKGKFYEKTRELGALYFFMNMGAGRHVNTKNQTLDVITDFQKKELLDLLDLLVDDLHVANIAMRSKEVNEIYHEMSLYVCALYSVLIAQGFFPEHTCEPYLIYLSKLIKHLSTSAYTPFSEEIEELLVFLTLRGFNERMKVFASMLLYKNSPTNKNRLILLNLFDTIVETHQKQVCEGLMLLIADSSDDIDRITSIIFKIDNLTLQGKLNSALHAQIVSEENSEQAGYSNMFAGLPLE